MKFNLLISIIVVYIIHTGFVSAIGIGTVVSVLSKLVPIYDYVKKQSKPDAELTNRVHKLWPYQQKLHEIQYKPKNSQDIFVFIVPDKSLFGSKNGDYPYQDFAQKIYDAINTAGSYKLSFKDTLNVLGDYSKQFDWSISTHVTYGEGYSRNRGTTGNPLYCWSNPKVSYVTIGPERDYLFDTSKIQEWHNNNAAIRKGKYICDAY